MSRIVVLVSGRGSNLEALLRELPGTGIEVAGVAADRPDAPALGIAAAHDVPAAVFPLAAFADREARDTALADWAEDQGAQLIVTAGYMAILTPGFIRRFPDRIVNVHPSLLPAFPGIRAIEQALDHGVKVTGVTVHLVDEGVDTGRILLQEAVAVPDGATVDELHALLRPVEHRLLPQAVRELAATLVS